MPNTARRVILQCGRSQLAIPRPYSVHQLRIYGVAPRPGAWVRPGALLELARQAEVDDVKALVCRGGRAVFEDRAEPEVRQPTDVMIRVSCAAICRTDVYVARGVIPVADGRVPGHEFAGIVESAGPAGTRVKPGDRVVVDPLIPCGACIACDAARPHECGDTRFLGIDRDGAFAELVVIDESAVHVLPADVPDTVGAYAEPLAAAMAVLEADLTTGSSVAVTGTGRIAALTSFVLRQFGHDVYEITDATRWFDVVVETDLCTANAEATLGLVRPGGTLVMKSRRPGVVGVPPLLCIPRRLRIECVHYAPFDVALAHLPRWSTWLGRFVGSEWPLEGHDRAFDLACADESLKVYFRPQS